jgi:hypothetical protein
MGMISKVVMPGLVPGIHVLSKKDVDGRDKPGQDEK